MEPALHAKLMEKAEWLADNTEGYTGGPTTLHNVKPLSSDTGAVILRKHTGAFIFFFLWYAREAKEMLFIAPTYGHVVGLRHIEKTLCDVEQANQMLSLSPEMQAKLLQLPGRRKKATLNNNE